MGTIKHDAIIVTSWNDVAIHAAALKAQEIGLCVLGPSQKALNNYQTILICPDGSKEGWSDSNDGDEKRAKFIDFLNGERFEDGSSLLEWVAVAYSSDTTIVSITNHAWKNKSRRLVVKSEALGAPYGDTITRGLP